MEISNSTRIDNLNIDLENQLDALNSTLTESLNTDLENQLDALNSTWIESLNTDLENKMDFWVRVTWDSVFSFSVLLAVVGNSAMLLIIAGNNF